MAATSLRPGALLAASDLTTSLPPGAGQMLVPVAFKPSQLPASGLGAGDHVVVVWAPTGSSSAASASASTARNYDAVVEAVSSGPDQDGFDVVDLLVTVGQRPRPGQGGGLGQRGPDGHQQEALMTVFALVSAGGSPGVTTTALALTLGWPSQVIMAECDPSGGDVLAGLLSGHLPARTGLLPLALEAGGGAEVPADALWRQLIELDEERNCLLLAGISDPRQSAALQSSLPWIADALQALRADVLADCGRLDAVAAVRPVLSAASLAVLVLRPTLRQVSRAVPRVEMLTNLVGRDRVVALLVGEGTASGREIARSLGVPVAGQLPDDPKTAGVLSDGLGSRRALDSRPLLRAATAAGRRLRDVAEAAGPRPGLAEETVFSVSGSHAQPSLDPFGDDPFAGDDRYLTRPGI